MDTEATVLMPLEVKARELDGRLYVATKFLKRGLACVIGSKLGVERAMRTIQGKGVFFDKGLDPLRYHFYRDLKKKGWVLVGMDEEGGMLTAGGDAEGQLLIRHDETIMPFVDLVCAWGFKQRDVIAEKRTDFPSDDIVATGHPKFDLCKEQFVDYFRVLGGGGDSGAATSRSILINTNFNYANNWVQPDELVKRFSDDGKWFSKSYFWERREYQQGILSSFVELARKVATAFPDESVLVRPHPTEDPSAYADQVSDLGNVRVACDGSVHEALSLAKLLIHHDCTTGIEGAIHGVPVISFQPHFDATYAQGFPASIGRKCKTADEVLETAKRFLADASVNAESGAADRERVAEYFANVDFDSADRIAEEVCLRLSGDTRRVRPIRVRLVGEGIVRRVSDRLTTVTNPDGAASVKSSQERKFPGLTKEELTTRIGLFRDIDPDLGAPAVTPLDEETYLLTPA